MKPAPLWRIPAMLWLAIYTLAGFTGFFATISALPVWLTQSGVSDSWAGQVTTVLLLATVSTQVLVPRLVKAIGMAPTLAAGLIALGAPSLGFLASSDLLAVMALCVLRGFGFGIITVLGSMMTAQLVPVERRGEAVGIYGLAIALPNLLAVPGGVALVSAGAFPVVAVLGAAPLLGLPFVAGLARGVAASEAGVIAGSGTAAQTDSDGVVVDSAASGAGVGNGAGVGSGDGANRDAGADRPSADAAATKAAERISRRRARNAAIIPSLVLLVVTLAGGAFLTYLPIERPSGSLATAAILVWGVTGALTRWRIGIVADRSGLGLLLPASSIAAVVGMVLVAVGLMIGAAAAGTTVVIVGAAALGAGYGSIQNLTLVAAFARARQQETATVSAIWNVGFDAGTAVGAALVGGLITVISVPLALGVTALIIVLAMPLAVISARPPTL